MLLETEPSFTCTFWSFGNSNGTDNSYYPKIMAVIRIPLWNNNLKEFCNHALRFGWYIQHSLHLHDHIDCDTHLLIFNKPCLAVVHCSLNTRILWIVAVHINIYCEILITYLKQKQNTYEGSCREIKTSVNSVIKIKNKIIKSYA